MTLTPAIGRTLCLLLLGLMMFVGSVAVSGHAWAQGTTKTTTNTPVDEAALAAKCKQYVGLSNRIASCIRDTLDSATDRFFRGVYPMVSRAIGGAMTLSIALFGILLAAGAVEKPGRDSMMLVIKIAFVSFLTMNSDYMYQNVIKMMDGAGANVVGLIPESGNLQDNTAKIEQVKCLRNMRSAQRESNRRLQLSAPWIGVDCMLDSVIGIKVDSNVNASQMLTDAKAFNEDLNNGEAGMQRGLMFLFFSSMQTSVIGAILAVVGLIFIWGLVQITIKSLFIFITGYMGVAVLMIISPLFIPLVLFQVTRGYFDKWVKLLISFALQPVVILLFVAFTITAVDLATFSGTYSLMYRIAGNASRAKGFSLNKYMTERTHPGKVENEWVSIITDEPFVYSNVKTQTNIAALTKDINFSGMGAVGNQIETGMVAGGIKVSECTPELLRKWDSMSPDELDAIIDGSNEDLKKELQVVKNCQRTRPLFAKLKTVNWDLMAEVRQPAVLIAAKDKDTVTKSQQIQREILSAAVFVAIVVFVMNELLKIIPTVVTDLLGDSSSPNLGTVGGALPGADAMKKAVNKGGG